MEKMETAENSSSIKCVLDMICDSNNNLESKLDDLSDLLSRLAGVMIGPGPQAGECGKEVPCTAGTDTNFSEQVHRGRAIISRFNELLNGFHSILD